MTPVPVVSTDYISAQCEAGWPDIHPEDYCHRCGCRNMNWVTDSDRFNMAIGPRGIDSKWRGIVCPQCFVELHEAATGLTVLWRLMPDGNFKGI